MNSSNPKEITARPCLSPSSGSCMATQMSRSVSHGLIRWRCIPLLRVVPGTGLEPVLPFGNLILSQKRLPFRHPGNGTKTLTSPTRENASAKKVHEVRCSERVSNLWPRGVQNPSLVRDDEELYDYVSTWHTIIIRNFYPLEDQQRWMDQISRTPALSECGQAILQTRERNKAVPDATQTRRIGFRRPIT